jgi:hypothetical protein
MLQFSPLYICVYLPSFFLFFRNVPKFVQKQRTFSPCFRKKDSPHKIRPLFLRLHAASTRARRLQRLCVL